MDLPIGCGDACDGIMDTKVVDLGGQEIAIQAARNFQALRKVGVTVRKTIDTVIATRCIESGYELLHNDRDFDPFAKHLGLPVVFDLPTG